MKMTKKPRIEISAAVCNNIGRIRRNNEDAFFLNGELMSKEDMDSGCLRACSSSETYQIYAVCDGMGGEEAGEEASFIATSGLLELKKRMNSKQDVRAAIDDYCNQVNSSIYSCGMGGHMGTTLAMLCIHGDRIEVAHLGDSRVYLFHDGKLFRLTSDHSETARLVSAGILTEEQARTHPRRNAISRYLGMSDTEMHIAPTYAEDNMLTTGDRYLICSDGLTDMLNDDLVASLLATGDPITTVQTLATAALNAGGKDNVTVLIVDVKTHKRNKTFWRCHRTNS